MPFTPAQQQAIAARNRELLVSAAAGSGKTAVLVERILRMIAEDGMSIDRMLIVTFTRAAASEMRERLETRLSAAAGGDERLQRQADMVASAQISTIHSFCQKTVRRYFQFCGIDPQFGLCDESTRAAFYRESMEETLDWLYAQAKEDGELKSLTAKYGERDISNIMDALYRFIMSRPDPMEWLDQHAQKEWSLQTLDAEPMARAFCAEAMLIIEGMLSLWHEANEAARHPAFPAKYTDTIMSDGEALRALADRCEAGLTALMQQLTQLKWSRLPVVRAKTSDEASLCEEFKSLRSRYKDMVGELQKLLPQDCEQAVSDMAAMAPATRGVARAVHFFHEAFQSRKREQAVIDFNDLEHMTLKILREPRLQQEMSRMFDAIFVDEYQDVSELQEAILNGLKRPADDARMQYAFYVGDVKQSIYRFRLAEPGLFLRKLSSFSSDENAPQRRIILNRNFRSKTAVLDSVNRVFEHVMDRRVTEIDYDADAMLYPGIPSEGDPQTELHILGSDGLRPKDQIIAEAEYIASDILATVGSPVIGGDGQPTGQLLKFSDIAILLPVSKGVADLVEMVLSRRGIPVYCEGAADPMASDEITQMIQYLLLMDNLMNDVALLSVLRSPLFELTEPELAQIRLLKPEREASFLMALTFAAQEGPQPLRARAEGVLHMLENERFYVNSMPLCDYLWDFLGRSGLYAHYGAQPGGKLRQANLRMLCHRASDWEKTHTDGLHGFVEALLLDGGAGETGPAVINPAENVVRIMTIHKSKGLEFPTVYVMNLGRSMFGRPSGGHVSVHGEVGFGLGYVNEVMRTRRPTLLQSAIALRDKNAERAERARVLYVALTRPKSRLVMVGSDSESSAGLEALIHQASAGSDVYAVRQAGSMLDWLLQCVTPQDSLEQFSTDGERKTAEPTAFPTIPTGFPQKRALWRVVFHIEPDVRRQKASKTSIPNFHIPIPEDDIPLISGAVSRAPREDPIAPKLSFTHLPLKVGVTALCRAIEEGAQQVDADEETAEIKRWPMTSAQPRLLSSLPAMPAFLEPPKEERALQVGVTTHKVLGLIDLGHVCAHVENPKALYAAVCRECERLVENGVMTAQEGEYVSRSMIARFLESPLGRRMLASPRVEREWSFNLRVTEPFSTIVQGVIDLCFVENNAWVLVDFKTDRVESAQQLVPRYERQVGFYRQALERGTPYAVRECVLYSLRLGEEARV